MLFYFDGPLLNLAVQIGVYWVLLSIDCICLRYIVVYYSYIQLLFHKICRLFSCTYSDFTIPGKAVESITVSVHLIMTFEITH